MYYSQMRVIPYIPTEIPKSVLIQLYKLNLRRGYMKKCLKRLIKDGVSKKCVFVGTIDKKVITWALIDYKRVCTLTRKPCLMVYTRSKYRNNGYASFLLKNVRHRFSLTKINVYPHDDDSYNFFKKNRLYKRNYF
jgi:hypothetical protein